MQDGVAYVRDHHLRLQDSSVPEAQLTDPVIKTLGLKLAAKVLTTATSAPIATPTAKVVVSIKSSATALPVTKKGVTIKRTVVVPAWEVYARSGRAPARTATVTCVSKDFSNPKVAEQQLTDTVIATLKLTVA
ncbi:hypothetical protein RQP46_004530 [Phenoliferia psychrophenolica]